MKRLFVILTMMVCLNILAQAQTETITVNGVKFIMVKVEGGTYTMGATSEQDSDAYEEEKPAHEVTVKTFYIGETEVTQALWLAVMGNNPSIFKGNQRPVEQVSWKQCILFLNELNTLTGKKFRLPTEDEWEYAARGGIKSNHTKFSGSNSIEDVAWYKENSGEQTHNVKTKKPNELGLYDMSGNVWEWTSSYWRNDYNSSVNPLGRVFRGGSWNYGIWAERVSSRDARATSERLGFIGLRLAL